MKRKIKQTTSLILILTMLVLSTSCGKVNKNLNPNGNLQDPNANLNLTVLPKQTWSEWFWSHKWATLVAANIGYICFNEYRAYGTRKELAEQKRINEQLADETKKAKAKAEYDIADLKTKTDNTNADVSHVKERSDEACVKANLADGKANNAINRISDLEKIPKK